MGRLASRGDKAWMRDQQVTGTAGPARAAGRRRWRPGLIDVYLIRSLAGPFLLALCVALLAMMLDRALSLVQEMEASGAHLSYFLPLLARLVPLHAGFAAPAALMIALMYLIARLDENVELEAMLASGVSLARIAAPLVVFSLLVGLAGLACTGWLEPEGRYGFRTLKAEALHAGDVGNLQPGAFYRPAEGLVFSFARRGAGGRVEGLFVRRDLGGGREQVATAPSGWLRRDASGLLELALDDGTVFEDANPRRRYGAYGLRFAHYAIRDGSFRARTVRPRGSDQKEMNLPELVAEAATGGRGLPAAAVEAELYARLARPLSVLLLPLLAIPLAFAAKKGRRGFGLAVGGAVAIGFHHLVNLVKNLSGGGSPPPGPAFALLCAGFGAGVIWLFVASRNLPRESPLTRLGGRIGIAAHRRRRLPALAGAGTLGTYVAANFALWVLATAAALVLVLQMVDLFERGDDFVARGFGLADVARYILLRLPLLLSQALPIATLVGAMIEMLRLGRFSEMLAIRAAGVSLPRIVAMMLPVALLLSLTSALLGEALVPRSEAELARWWQASAPAADKAQDRWFRIGGEIVHAERGSAAGLAGLTLYRLSQGRLVERVAADSAVPAAGGWRLAGARASLVGAGAARTRRLGTAIWRTRLAAADVPALFAPTPFLTAADARRALAGARPVAEGPARFLTRLQRSFAAPLAPLVMLLLAAPLALAPGHRRVTAPRLLFPVLAGMAFLVADGVLTVSADTGMIAPWLGAWAAPLLFGLLAITAILYNEA